MVTTTFPNQPTKTVRIIDDISNVQEDITDSVEPELQGASVMAVKELKQYYACEFCKAKIELDDDDHLL